MGRPDDARREALLREATAMAMEDVAIIPIHYQIASWAARNGLRYRPRTDEGTLAHSIELTAP